MRNSYEQDTRIKNHLAINKSIDLYALVKEMDEGSVHALLQHIQDYGERNNIAVDSAFHLQQAKDIRRQLSSRHAGAQLLDALCHQLSMLQTGSIVGKYCNDDSVHHFYSSKAEVAMFGDSITQGAQWHEIFPGTNIINRGIGGDITHGMLGRVGTVLRSQPEKVFIMAGINDISSGYAVDGILQRYEKIVDAFLDNNVQVFVQSTLYTGHRLEKNNALVAQLNAGLNELSAQKKLQFIDVASVLCPDGVLPATHSFDDLHLNGVAYSKWAGLIERFIKQE